MVFCGSRSGELGRRVVLVDGNVLHLAELGRDEARHSPDGFEWGYGGSGPAELARAILVTVLQGDRAVRTPACYQRFKWDVVARFGGSWRLSSEEVLAWVERWKQSDEGRAVEEFLAIKERLAGREVEWEGGG